MFIIKKPWLLLLSAFLNGCMVTLIIVRYIQTLSGAETSITNGFGTVVLGMLLFGLSGWIAISHLKLLQQNQN
ncbi:MAG: hypothetical protein ABJN69_03015 [Hellea sp.]